MKNLLGFNLLMFIYRNYIYIFLLFNECPPTSINKTRQTNKKNIKQSIKSCSNWQ